MNKKLITLITVGIFSFALSSTSFADSGTLGKSYILPEVLYGQFGDNQLDEDLDAYYGGGVTLNVNLVPHLDLQVGGGYLWADGDRGSVDLSLDQMAGAIGLLAFMDPEAQMTPYAFASFNIVDWEVEAKGPGGTSKQDDTDEGFGGGAGVQFKVTPKFIIDASGNYLDVGDSDSWGADLDFGYWFRSNIQGTLGGSYNFDSEDMSILVGALFTL
ncbi:MAG TPA: outer membrane beta-barrel protein [Kiritimatiellia bacterium]|nr:outer membrane beta-barrel protein [Kiritimatiellia bacterium]HMP33542.1 outer membrane beta-barrel protein [Kiritimatiellia bacterium]